jgi:hypothetical protein
VDYPLPLHKKHTKLKTPLLHLEWRRGKAHKNTVQSFGTPPVATNLGCAFCISVNLQQERMLLLLLKWVLEEVTTYSFVKEGSSFSFPFEESGL